jgi:membrane protease YdiL (CAAX protease family)
MSDLPVPDPNAEVPTGTLEALDIQHDTDPSDDHGPARRIPHLGHALLFFSVVWMMINLSAVILLAAGRYSSPDAPTEHPGVMAVAQALGFILGLAAAFKIFPRLWERSFLHGIQWNVLAVHRRWFFIVPSAIALSLLAQLADHYVKNPDDTLIAQLMHTTHGAWLITGFGVILAPLTEEIAFRGFLLPALATAYDWLSLERSPAGLRKWEMTSSHSTPAVIFGAVFSSIPFALMHAGQLSHVWGAVGVLFVVSLALSFVRIKTHSVACSVLMHATYNLTVFVGVFIATGGYRHLDKL